MLSSLHGIGIIRLDIENPSESEIVIPAHERLNLDWSSINRIYEINSDFKKYINEFKDFCQTGKTKESDWD
ncbi:MAG: hypothetical protein BWY78_00415 [Alphaproteobacteria bacterium ADurb.Bin438]|nr:MAG: hypothetical protein BWY78_00415 [Alphaproteobacteria bacterium ADurb.Bin438]